MTAKRALITGVTGQDGAYLAQSLLGKNYEVFGTTRGRPESSPWRLKELGIAERVTLLSMDLTNTESVFAVVAEVSPDEVYNLAAQSVVAHSFDEPLATGDVDGLGVVRLLEALRQKAPQARFLQASSSNLFGQATSSPQNESTAFHPRSPYAIAKLYAHGMTQNYRECQSLFACNAILFNHESPLRGEQFVTRKITRGLVERLHLQGPPVTLGDLEAARDWGYAGDFVEAMWSILQCDTAQDFVLATGVLHTVREFVVAAAAELGVTLEWQTRENREVGVDSRTGQVLVETAACQRRPADTVSLRGDGAKARRLLGWTPQLSFQELVRLMVQADLARAGKPSCAAGS